MKTITEKQTVEKVYNNLCSLNKGVKQAFSSIKKEMDGHLDSINQNTNEIQSCYEYLTELDSKMDLLNERLDDMELLLKPEMKFSEDINLSLREQEVFMILYANEEPLTAIEVSRRLGFTVEMVERYLNTILTKGVPILKNFNEGQVFLSLDLKFKDLQARKNILNIDEGISQQLLNEKMI